MKRLANYLLLIVILSSCSSNYHLRRAKYHEKLAVAKGAEIDLDTLWRTIEIPVPEVKTDTVFESEEGDTVVIQKDRLSIKYVNLPGEKVYIEGKCEADTIRENIYYRITKTIKAPKGFMDYLPWILLAIGLIAVWRFR